MGWGINGSITTAGKPDTLANIVAQVTSTGTIAQPNDVQGCTLQSNGTKWIGCAGVLSPAQISALTRSNLDKWWYINSATGDEVHVESSISLQDPSLNTHPVLQTIMSGSVATNNTRPTTATIVAVTPTAGQAFSIPSGYFTAAAFGKVLNVSIGLGIQLLSGAEKLTILLQTTGGITLLQWGIDNRGVNYPSAVNSCLELSGWIHPTSGGSNSSLNLQSHSEYRLNGYWGGQPGDGIKPITLGLETYPAGVDNTVDIPLKLVVQWDAQTNLSATTAIGGRFALSDSGGYFQRTPAATSLAANASGAARTSSAPNIASILGIADNGFITVAVGNTGLISRSLDGGVNWRTVYSVTGSTALQAVTWSSGLSLFCAVGNNGVIVTSPDGAIWTVQSSGTTNTLRDVAWNATYGFVVCQSSATVQYLTSTNGSTWVVQTGSGAYGYGVILNGSTIVLCSGSGSVKVYNGSTWNNYTAGAANISSKGVYNSTINKYVIGNSAGAIYYSSDAITWTLGTSNSTHQINQLASIGGVILAVGNSDYVAWSTDGIAFTLLKNSGASSIYGDWIKLEY